MDPLSAFGLACNVFQALSFAHESITLLYHISKGRHPDKGLVTRTTELSDLSKTLVASLKQSRNTSGVFSADDVALLETATKARSVVEKLEKVLKEISNARGGSLGIFTKYITRKSTIAQLTKDVDSILESVKLRLSVDSRYVPLVLGFPTK
jgi:hypothetical protein